MIGGSWGVEGGYRIMGWFNFCEHDWELIDKEVGESAMEEYRRAGYVLQSTWKGTSTEEMIAMTSRLVSRVFKCGKVWVHEGRV